MTEMNSIIHSRESINRQCRVLESDTPLYTDQDMIRLWVMDVIISKLTVVKMIFLPSTNSPDAHLSSIEFPG